MAIGILLPFIGTTLGAFFVFFTGKKVNDIISDAIKGFSSGVMIAASVWSLIIPAIELSEDRGKNPIFAVGSGFFLGIFCFIVCEYFLNKTQNNAENISYYRGKSSFLPCIAVALHNFPEGMAVGAVFAQAIFEGSAVSLSAAMALSIGIAVQDIPEGAIISIPLFSDGIKKKKAFFLGSMSGIVEPIGALLTILAADIAVPFLPIFLGFAAGAMIFAVLDSFFELDSRKNKAFVTLSFTLGFMIMMSLDVILG